jgi:deazaflavin-dependent oxidoreductase (nitroreductase family)
MSVPDFAARRTMRLTTRGRKSGAPRTVTVWFVVDGERSVLVQHAARRPAHWYHNLIADPVVSIDFGTGPIPARATPISDPLRVQDLLAQVRRKYWSAWIIQLIGRSAQPLAAEISW